MNNDFYVFVCAVIAVSLLIIAIATVLGMVFFTNHFKDTFRKNQRRSVNSFVSTNR